MGRTLVHRVADADEERATHAPTIARTQAWIRQHWPELSRSVRSEGQTEAAPMLAEVQSRVRTALKDNERLAEEVQASLAIAIEELAKDTLDAVYPLLQKVSDKHARYRYVRYFGDDDGMIERETVGSFEDATFPREPLAVMQFVKSNQYLQILEYEEKQCERATDTTQEMDFEPPDGFFFGVSRPFIPRKFSSHAMKRHWDHIGSSLIEVGQSLDLDLDPLDEGKSRAERLRQLRALKDAGQALMLLGAWLKAIAPPDAPYCDLCFRRATKRHRCHVHATLNGKHSRANHLAEKIRPQFEEKLRTLPTAGFTNMAWHDLKRLASATTDDDVVQAFRQLARPGRLGEPLVKMMEEAWREQPRQYPSALAYWRRFFAMHQAGTLAPLELSDLHLATLYRHLRRMRAWIETVHENQEKLPRERTRIDAETREKIMDMHQQGVSLRKIGAQFGVTHTAVDKVIRARSQQQSQSPAT